jgi:UDP-N-acetylmuramoyl-tripeptide--D-alanyl-D-alanine ligase
MMRLTEAAKVLQAKVAGFDVAFEGVSTDTRTLKQGHLFVAIRGERYDGHGFLAAAADAGAAAAMVDSAGDKAQSRLPLLVVDDTRLALGRLAGHWRGRFRMPLVALTGSSGKTTVKEMLAAILRHAAGGGASRAGTADPVLATRGNLNNDIGLPLMLLDLRQAHHYAVIEMGMNHAGEIRYLAQLADPDVALVTNAGRAHIEFLGSEEAIARAKSEIFESLRPEAIAVFNADDVFAPLWRELTRGRRCVTFGLEQAADMSGTYQLRELESDIVLKSSSGQAPVRLSAPGVHNVRNALAAAAAATALDVPLGVIAAGLERFSGIKGRLQRKRGLNGAVLIDDTYNANPESVRAALCVLAQAPGRRIFVFGDMGELGREAARLHAEIGACAKEAHLECMLTLGESSAEASRTFGRNAKHFSLIEDLLADLQSALAPDVTVLVKGSRFMKMERVVQALERDDKREAQAVRREEKKA